MLSKGITKAYVFEGIERTHEFSRDSAVKLLLEQAKADNIVKAGDVVLFVGKTPISGEEYFPNIFEILTIS
jgi:hypothetical protein